MINNKQSYLSFLKILADCPEKLEETRRNQVAAVVNWIASGLNVR